MGLKLQIGKHLKTCLSLVTGRTAFKFKSSSGLQLTFKMKYKLKAAFSTKCLISNSKTFSNLWVSENSFVYVKGYAILTSVVIARPTSACIPMCKNTLKCTLLQKYSVIDAR